MNAPQVEGNVNSKSFLLINMVEMLINVVELDHCTSAGKTLVNKMGFNTKRIFVLFKVPISLFLINVCNIGSFLVLVR